MELFLTALGALVLIPIIMFYSTITWGFVVSKFYSWFILSIFTGLPHISVLWFIGIMFFLNAILPKHYDTIKEEYKDKRSVWPILILSPWIILLCGYILHLFY